jgi:ATP-dependent DNA helicase RecG
MIESKNIEFKRILNRGILKEIIAFANTQGGKIYIGINDNGNRIGLEDVKSDAEKLSSMIKDNIQPSILNYVDVSIDIKENLLIIEVQRGDGKPYYLTDKGMKPSGVFVRLGNTSVPVSEEDIRNMIIENHGLCYETTRSLDQNLSFEYAKQQFDIRGIAFGAKQMKTLGFYDEDQLYTNLALLISDQCPHIIKAAIFKGDDKTDFKHRQEFAGSLLKQLDDVYLFLTMQNHMDTSYEGLRRVDTYYYDQVALREGLINAIIHRDYGIGGNIFVNVYKHSCEFISLGSLPKGIVLEDIYEGVSKARNEKLAGVFYRLELIEAYGTGIMKIMKAYKNSHLSPEIKITPGAFILRLPSFAQEYMNDSDDSPIVKESSRDYSTKPLGTLNLKDQAAVLNDIIENTSKVGYITRKGIQERYGFGQTKSGNLLRALEVSGRLIKHGKGKNSYYIVKEESKL